MYMYLKGHQSCSLSKFEWFDLLHKNRLLGDFQIWHPLTFVPLEVKRNVLPFWKSPINVSLEPDFQGCCSNWSVCQAMLKISILLISYYTRKLSIGQDCTYVIILILRAINIYKNSKSSIGYLPKIFTIISGNTCLQYKRNFYAYILSCK